MTDEQEPRAVETTHRVRFGLNCLIRNDSPEALPAGSKAPLAILAMFLNVYDKVN
jgi:hypothetical protein